MNKHKYIRILILITACCTFTAAAQDPADPYAPKSGIPEGCKIIQGDIIVRIDAPPPPPGTHAFNLWPNGVVPYEFDSNVSADNRQRAINAMAEWEMVANVHFQPRNGASYYIHIQNSNVNNSFVGKQGGEQIVNIHNWGTRFVIVHELGHALGLWHEQSRADRDNYVIIHLDRIEDDNEHNFDKQAGAGIYGPYDFDSVMHYGQCSFSTCDNCNADPANCRTISMRPGYENMQDIIGQRDHLSNLDQITMWVLYPDNGTIFVDKYYGGIQLGTLSFPFATVNAGYAAAPNYGTLAIKPGSYNETGYYNKPVTFMAPLGGVTIGE